MVFRKRNLIAFVFVVSLLQTSCFRSFERVLTVPGAMLPQGSFDGPGKGASIQGPTIFGGWGAHRSGIAFVALYMDGVYVTRAATGVYRPDVLKALPQYKRSMVTGFNALVDVTPWPAGPHHVIAKIVSKIGTDCDFPMDVVVVK